MGARYQDLRQEESELIEDYNDSEDSWQKEEIYEKLLAVRHRIEECEESGSDDY